MNTRSDDSEDPVPFHSLNIDRPLLLLDIDGVLNPLGSMKPDDWDDFVALRIGGFPLWLSARMGNAISRLDATVMWCSTWCDDPHEIVEITRHLGGLSPLWGGLWGTNFRWKPDLVRAALKVFPLVIWVDDDEPIIDDAPDHLVRITPSASHGLRPNDLDEMSAYLAAWRHLTPMVEGA